MPGASSTSRQGARGGRAFGQQKGDLGLQRIGVLELVDQQEPVAALKVAADGSDLRGIGAGGAGQQVAGPAQEVVEVERARAKLGVGGGAGVIGRDREGEVGHVGAVGGGGRRKTVAQGVARRRACSSLRPRQPGALPALRGSARRRVGRRS